MKELASFVGVRVAMLLLMLLTAVFPALSQHEFSSFTATGRGGATSFVTDYQAVGINPANLGWTWKFEEKKVALGFTEFSYSMHSDALTKQELREEFKTMINNKNATDFTYSEKVQAAKDFADAGLAINFDLGSAGMAYTHEKVGGFGFRINDRFQWYSRLGPTASDLVFLGKTSSYFDQLTWVNSAGDTNVIANDTNMYDYDTMNIVNGVASVPSMISELMDGSRLTMNWYREYNLSYGRKIFEIDSTIALYGGIGIKYLQGIGILDINGTGDEFEAFAATSTFFGIDYGNAALSNPSADTSEHTGFLPKSVGSGWGYDLGIGVTLFNKLKIGMALTNVGSITWSGNVYTVKDTFLVSTEHGGLNSYNIFNNLDGLVGEDGVIEWEGLTEKKVNLPSAFRFGASIELGNVAEVGFDMILPGNTVPGNFDGAIIGFGGDLKPLPWLKIQAGFLTGGNYDFQIPVGLTLASPTGGYEFGIASRDAITFFAQNGPTLSMSVGFMRMRF